MTLAALIIVASCSWSAPGADRYTGDVSAAVDHYADIPVSTREALKRKVKAHKFDEVVEIKRDSIGDGTKYEPSIRDMHFGARKLCKEVDRSSWKASATERGLVFCESGSCLLLPTVCGNLSRLVLKQKEGKLEGGGGFGLAPMSPLQLSSAPAFSTIIIQQPEPVSLLQASLPASPAFALTGYQQSSTYYGYSLTAPMHALPEPSTLLLSAIGVIALFAKRSMKGSHGKD